MLVSVLIVVQVLTVSVVLLFLVRVVVIVVMATRCVRCCYDGVVNVHSGVTCECIYVVVRMCCVGEVCVVVVWRWL